MTGRPWFDRFAAATSAFASTSKFFVVCVLMVLLWAPSRPLFGSADSWQLVINTGTTIVTFLLVALLQNSSHRADLALQQKLNAVADGLADLMEHVAQQSAAGACEHLVSDVHDLRASVGLEERTTTS